MITPEREKEFIDKVKYPYIALFLHHFCTHQCWYCCSGPMYNNPRTAFIDEIGSDIYIKKVLGLADGKICEYRINGGEPFESPHCGNVSKAILEAGHYITYLSNLTHIDKVYDICLPYKDKIRFEASFHLGAYIRQNSERKIQKYINEYFVKACEMSYEIQVVIVLTPDVLADNRLELYKETLLYLGSENNCKVTFCMQELYLTEVVNAGGVSITRDYPRAYNTAQKKRILELGGSDIDSLQKINKELILKGWDCFYMNRMIDVHANGEVSRCNSGVPYHRERLMDTSMRISDGYSPCSYDGCRCITRGEIACLLPNGVSLNEYCKIKKI
jgi:organic radical activating enzyme